MPTGLTVQRRQSAHIDRIVESAARNKLLLFLGAGVSAGSSLPTGAELAAEMARELGVAGAAGATGLPQIAGRYEAAMGRLALTEFLRARIATSAGTVSGTHDLIASLPVSTVVTTNYDTLLEDAYERAGLPVNRICTQADVLGLSAGDRQLFKIHGSIDRSETDDGVCLIVTEADFYEHFLAGQSIFYDVLKAWFLTKTCVFIGFGLRDPNFLHLYFSIKEMVESVRADMSGKFYAVQRGPHPLDVLTWRRFGVEILDAGADDFLNLVGERLEFANCRVENRGRVLAFQPAAPLVRVPVQVLAELAAEHGHYHRFVLLSPRKHRALFGTRRDDCFVELTNRLPGGSIKEFALALPSAVAETGLAVPKQLRTRLRLPHGAVPLETVLEVRRASLRPRARLEIAADQWLGRAWTDVNGEAELLYVDRRDEILEAFASDGYVQIRPLELRLLGLVPLDRVTIGFRDRTTVPLLVLPHHRDNLAPIYLPDGQRQRLGLTSELWPPDRRDDIVVVRRSVRAR